MSSENQFEKLPISVIEHIISLIPHIDIKEKCKLRCCNTTWKNIIDNTKMIEISDNDIPPKGGIISNSYISIINDKITILNIKLSNTSHTIKTKKLYNFIKQFSRLEQCTIWTWKSYSASDLKLLLKIDVKSFKIIDCNANQAVFYLDDKKLKIFKVIYGSDFLKDKYTDIDHLIASENNQLNDQWSWFKGEIYINPFKYRCWMDSCKEIHFLEHTCLKIMDITVQ